MVSLKQLYEWFTTGKFPTQAQFAEQFKSFWHKSEKIDQSSILGLSDALADKATKSDLQNLTNGLHNMGEVANLAALNAIVNPQDGDAYKVISEKDTNGNSYIYRYTVRKDENGNVISRGWVNTKLIAFDGNVATVDDLDEKADKDIFSITSYYVSRGTGELVPDAGYKCTPFLPVKDLDGNSTGDITITGYIGGVAGIYVFYDEFFERINYDYPTNTGQQTVVISQNDIPDNAEYIRCTSSIVLSPKGKVKGVKATITRTLEETYRRDSRSEIFNVSERKPIDGFYDRRVARLAVPRNLRKSGLRIAYQAEDGWCFEKFIGNSQNFANSDTLWIDDSYSNRQTFTKVDGLGLNLHGETYVDYEERGHTNYVRIADGMSIYRYSVLSGNKVSDTEYASVFLYDSNFRYIGYLTEKASGNVIDKYTFDLPSILLQFPTAKYFRTNIYNKSGFNIISPNKRVIVVSDEQAEKIRVSNSKFNIVGYVYKSSGVVITDTTAYRCTPYLIIDSSPNLIVTGWSGITNSAALVVCFDKFRNYLGFVNADVHGAVSDYIIPKNTLPKGTAYIRCNASSGQPTRKVIGADLIVNNADWQDFIINTPAPQIQPANDSLTTSQGKLSVNIADGSGDSKTRPMSEYDIKRLLNNILPFKNYLGNAENIHPKVLYFNNGLWGYKYWMAYTPYPLGNTTAENPCIAVSNDGVNWTVPNGLVNPLAFPPENSNGGYNSDTHLVYREDIKTLECWYRPVKLNPTRDAIVRKVTTDGVNWGKEEVVIDYGTSYNNVLSPAVIFENGKYKMWTCTGNYVMYRETADDTINNWTSPIRLPIEWGNLNAWHLDVINNGVDGYDMVVCAFGLGGGNNSADLYHVKQLYNGEFTKPIAIVKRSKNPLSITFRSIYRSSIVLVNNEYNLYVSSIDNNWHRYMYLFDNSILLNTLLR